MENEVRVAKPVFPVKSVDDRQTLRSAADKVMMLESDLRKIANDLRREKRTLVVELAKRGYFDALSVNMAMLRHILS